MYYVLYILYIKKFDRNGRDSNFFLLNLLIIFNNSDV